MKAVIAPISEPSPTLAHGPGHAPLPAEWAEWSEEPGVGVRLEEGGVLHGALHVIIVGRDEAWLEGLWVHPSTRGRGVGRQLVAEAERVARQHGAATVRTAVPARDYAAMAVAERMGYLRATRADVLVAEIEAGPIDIAYDAQVAPTAPTDVPAIVRVLSTSEALAGWRGLVPLGWRFRRLVPELLHGLIKSDRVVRSGERVEGVVGFALRGQTAVIAFLCGPRAQQQALYGAVAERARGAGANRIAMFVPDAAALSGIRAPFAAHTWCPDGLVIVEKRLAGPDPAPRPRTSQT